MVATIPPTRRGFVATLSGLVGVAISAVVLTPAISLLLHPSARSAAVDPTCECGKLRDLRTGVPRKVDVFASVRDAWDRSDRKHVGGIWVVRRDDRRIDAFSAVCPHQGCVIDFDPARGVFVCPCHQGEFALADGARVTGPSPRGLDPLPVAIRGDSIVVTFIRYVQGLSSRRRV